MSPQMRVNGGSLGTLDPSKLYVYQRTQRTTITLPAEILRERQIIKVPKRVRAVSRRGKQFYLPFPSRFLESGQYGIIGVTKYGKQIIPEIKIPARDVEVEYVLKMELPSHILPPTGWTLVEIKLPDLDKIVGGKKDIFRW